MAEKKIFSTVTKTLLKNVIRHTDSHNKVVEENEMWKQREKEMSGKSSDYSFLKDRRSDMRYEFSSRRERRAHMDEEPQSTYWMKQLYKAEEADSNRWGHSGFKELYPEHFSSTEYSSSSDESLHRKQRRQNSDCSHRKRRKREHSDSDTDSEVERPKKHKKKYKQNDKRKHKKRKHKKKKHRKETSDSS